MDRQIQERENEQRNDKFYLSIHIETKDDAVEIPMGDKNAFQVRTDGVFCDGTLIFWENIISVMLTPKWEKCNL